MSVGGPGRRGEGEKRFTLPFVRRLCATNTDRLLFPSVIYRERHGRGRQVTITW
jgi:hypothetical protein